VETITSLDHDFIHHCPILGSSALCVLLHTLEVAFLEASMPCRGGVLQKERKIIGVGSFHDKSFINYGNGFMNLIYCNLNKGLTYRSGMGSITTFFSILISHVCINFFSLF